MRFDVVIVILALEPISRDVDQTSVGSRSEKALSNVPMP
jgi:hypothetical protein